MGLPGRERETRGASQRPGKAGFWQSLRSVHGDLHAFCRHGQAQSVAEWEWKDAEMTWGSWIHERGGMMKGVVLDVVQTLHFGIMNDSDVPMESNAK